MGSMDSCTEVPEFVHQIEKDNRNLSFNIAYCGDWGLPTQVEYAEKIISIVFPSSKIILTPDGPEYNVIIKCGDKKVYDV